MSTTMVILLVGVAVYLAFAAFVIGLCRIARRADEAEEHPRLVMVRTDRFLRRDGDEPAAGERAERAAREVRGP